MLAENYIPGVPALYEDDLENAKSRFVDYIFVSNEEKDIKGVYCSACGEKYLLKFPCRMYTNEEYDLYKAKHRQRAVCPRCKKESVVINTGRKKKLSDLTERKAVAFIMPISYDEVIIRCELLYKKFYFGRTEFYRESYEVYRFKKNEPCEYYRSRYYYNDFILAKKLREPFYMISSFCGGEWLEYRVIGLGRLDDTFMKYAFFMDGRFKGGVNDGFRYLALYCEFPKLTEMLLKLGYEEIIRRKISGSGLKQLCRWTAENPRDFFKLSREELDKWKKYRNDVDVAKTYISLFRGEKDGFELAKRWEYAIGCYNDLSAKRLIKRLHITPKELILYLDKTKQHFYIWSDYIEAAKDVGRDLTVHNVIFPKNLSKAHDEAVKARTLAAERLEEEKARARYETLDKKYGFEKDGYLIRPPKSAKEIIDEGNALKHCVGGYAARHAEGQTDILFMRLSKEKDVPLYTIEMRKGKLMQVHGMKNQTSPYDVPAAAAFFEEWLAWVKDGSPRNNKKSKKRAEERAQEVKTA